MWPFRRTPTVHDKLDNLLKGQRDLMITIDDLKAAQADENAKIDALLTFASQTQAHVADLEQQVDALQAAGTDTASLQAAIDAMKAKSTAIAGFLTPPAPAPTPDPVTTTAATPATPST